MNNGTFIFKQISQLLPKDYFEFNYNIPQTTPSIYLIWPRPHIPQKATPWRGPTLLCLLQKKVMPWH